MIGRVVLAIVCHLAYLNIFTVILNAPAVVVAPSVTFSGKEAESVVHETSGANFVHSENQGLARLGLDFSGSGPKGEDQLREASASTTYDLKVSDEETLLRLVEARRKHVITQKQIMDPKGFKLNVDPDERPLPFGSLEQSAVTKTAIKELRLEKSRFSLPSIYQRISERGQWKQDQLSGKLRNLIEINSSVKIEPPEAQRAIERLSILEYKGLEFSEEEGQLIENLSEQAETMGSIPDNVRFTLSDVEKDLIEKLAWERVVKRKVEEITLKMEDLKQIAESNKEDSELILDQKEFNARRISPALEDMKAILSHDSAQWSPEITSLLKNINSMKTDGDHPEVELPPRDLTTTSRLRGTAFRVWGEKQLGRSAVGVQTGQDGERFKPPISSMSLYGYLFILSRRLPMNPAV
ncbi:hypothetical protein Pst134EB_004413 [Puccinia striiformis f. sp. tritici]|nr:hypothetical protein Pst134EB_004413 [Puccinia striiformis f. sp. tritici]